MAKLDKKDCVLMDELQKNCRISLTQLAQKVNLSIDSVKKRINKLENERYYPKIQIRPRSFGFKDITQINIKFNNHNSEEINKFIEYLVKHERIAEVFSFSGEWDLSFVIFAKDSEDQQKLRSKIKIDFGNLIGAWSESVTLKVHKFETYNLQQLYNSGDLNE